MIHDNLAKRGYSKCILHGRFRVVHRRSDRETSRILVKQLGRALQKSRLIWRLVRNNLKKSVPKSTRIPEFMNKSAFYRLGMYCSCKARKTRRKSFVDKSSRIREFTNKSA